MRSINIIILIIMKNKNVYPWIVVLCQFVSAKHRGTAYGIMNMTGVFAGAAVTQLLGKWTDGGSLGEGFAMLSIIVLIALALQLYFLRPKTDNME